MEEIRLVWLAIAAKAVLAGLVLASLVAPGLVEFSERGTVGRALASVAAIAVVPVWWVALGRRRRRPYPARVDLLLPLPFVVDYLARALDLGRLGAWDPIAHAFDFAALVTVVAIVAAAARVGPLVAAGLSLGVGAAAALLWELLEYAVLENHGASAYEGTMQDLAVAVTVSAAVAVAAFGLRRRVH